MIGANNVTQASLPHLSKSVGNVIYMSTTGASYTAPWVGLGVYQVTKAALNRLVDHWRVEQPGINFTVVTIGECGGGQGIARRSSTSTGTWSWWARSPATGSTAS